jgi:hypothetical protein
MKITQAWGWLTAGVLAAGLNASYHHGGLQWAHEIAGSFQHNSAAVLALASGNADQFLAEVQSLKGRNETRSCPLAGALSRTDHRISDSDLEVEESEVISLPQEAALARWDANRARIEAKFAAQAGRFHMASATFAPVIVKSFPAPVVCPRVHVNIPRMPMVKIPATPRIHIDLPSTSVGPV